MQEDAIFQTCSQLILVSTYIDDTLKAFARERARRGVSVAVFVCGQVLPGDFEDGAYSLFVLQGSEKKEAKLQ